MKNQHRSSRQSAFTFVLVVSGAVALLACGDSEETTDGTSEATTTTGAGGSGGSTTSTGGTGGTGGTIEPCDLVEHPMSGAFVLFTPGAGDPPAPAGGTISDGTFSFSAVQNYNGSATSGVQGFKNTLVFSEGGTRYAQRNTADQGGIDQGACGDVVVNGTALTLHPTSWPDGATPQGSDTEYFGFTATPGQLLTHWYPGQQTTQVNINTHLEQ